MPRQLGCLQLFHQCDGADPELHPLALRGHAQEDPPAKLTHHAPNRLRLLGIKRGDRSRKHTGKIRKPCVDHFASKEGTGGSHSGKARNAAPVSGKAFRLMMHILSGAGTMRQNLHIPSSGVSPLPQRIAGFEGLLVQGEKGIMGDL